MSTLGSVKMTSPFVNARTEVHRAATAARHYAQAALELNASTDPDYEATTQVSPASHETDSVLIL